LTEPLKAPFPWFGGKSLASDLIWDRLGNVPNYVEPFAGSLAVLLSRPHDAGLETVNDLDGFVCNAWRAILHDPVATAHACDWPVSEPDLSARHLWLNAHRAELTDRLSGDTDYYDAKIAGWWLWGIASWIGGGWCSGNGPWQSIDGLLTDTRQLPHLGNAGQGVKRQLPNLGDAGRGVNRKRPHLGTAGQGVNRKLPHLGDAGRGVVDWLLQLSDRMRRVRVCCGDWTRVMGPTVTGLIGGNPTPCGVVLDPPYSAEAGRAGSLYACEDLSVAHNVREWALANGDNPRLRIVLCGYDGEHDMPGWSCAEWKTSGGYGCQGETTGRANRTRERLWFSPHCMATDTKRQGILEMDDTHG